LPLKSPELEAGSPAPEFVRSARCARFVSAGVAKWVLEPELVVDKEKWFPAPPEAKANVASDAEWGSFISHMRKRKLFAGLRMCAVSHANALPVFVGAFGFTKKVGRSRDRCVARSASQILSV
jgi:hypothetical protein